MTERDKIMSRIRAALRVPAPHPGSHVGVEQTLPSNNLMAEAVQQWLPDGGESLAEQVQRFRVRSAELKTDFQLADSQNDVHMVLGKLADNEKWKRIATHNGLLTDAAVSWLGLPALNTTGGYNLNELEACNAGITECDALIAQTGSIILTSRDSGGRALSVLPPHHVVLTRCDQVVRDLSAGFKCIQKKYGPDYPSMISVITGPSRTGDIERILVLGAHGPKKLTIICWQSK
jgi:L-lactate dehydrogenase complex protein LldG